MNSSYWELRQLTEQMVESGRAMHENAKALQEFVGYAAGPHIIGLKAYELRLAHNMVAAFAEYLADVLQAQLEKLAQEKIEESLR